MDESPSWEANIPTASQEIPRIIWNLKVHYSLHSSSPPILTLSQINPLYALLLFLNPLNPELNPMCCLLALLGAHHFLYVSRIRDKSLTFRRLMSYIYIWSTHS